VNISFKVGSAFLYKPFQYLSNPSSAALVESVSPSKVSEVGGQTVRIDLVGLQVVDSEVSLECEFASAGVFAEVLDVWYSVDAASVVVLLPALLPGLVEGKVGPKSNSVNRATFTLEVLSSVPFTVDALSVDPPVVYQDFAGNISIRMTGVPPQVSVTSFHLSLGSFVVPRSQMKVVPGASRSDFSTLLFTISGAVPAASSSALSCILQFSGDSQTFSFTVLPTIPQATLAFVSPTSGSSLGGSVVYVEANQLRELVPPERPRFYVDHVDCTPQFSVVNVVSDKFTSSVTFVAPNMTHGIRKLTMAHPLHFGSNVTFTFESISPIPEAEPLVSSIRRGANVTMKVLISNFFDLSSLVFTCSSEEYGNFSSANASVVRTVTVTASVALVTVVLPAARVKPAKSEVLWIVEGKSAVANFSLVVEASDAPFLASFSPVSVFAYGGVQVNFIVTSFGFPVALSDWTCSFSFANVSANSVTPIDSSTVSVLRLAVECASLCIIPSCFLLSFVPNRLRYPQLSIPVNVQCPTVSVFEFCRSPK